jgi:hypothetical protein
MLIFPYDVNVYNRDAIIILKFRCRSTLKIITIIMTSLTSNNCIDAKNSPMNNNNKKKTNTKMG